ncbi:MAG: DNA methyltransferase [Candidatus Moranbacteria bacterium CG_4_10_14_3_um_filter_44_15]|nr:MAG: DNA methyltransferase [Candidatus Moranbacteria bacterium CG06_land_8_20_14_3_00_43_56]PIV84411.1 MAG: DNA methyltransferase [Candidatus Moranbacteria bacterium CG17_big_fil_post_rev_8_21_14_2_50_44_12]PIW92849.1 MAG: DNA methyltransferase [Candidatus Moranbacteria bacterium CG_4_8_14_3_um_filter_43_15]PIX90489.1 MAG: DNA methyltransferase [Candidatus Moranbacteria bacterium CG_4_10_14_3_um_filter_44_15]PJA86430.1 MAG: DNA methyltransferase [Candidatus Moranbacteria bacterium CG_4_9_14_
METQGIKYTGSKREILPVLLRLIKPLNVKTVLDGFSGTTRVSQALKQAGYTVYANDIADWSKVFGECYLLNRKPASYYLPLIDRLNNLPGKYGWFSENYGGEPNGGSATQKDGRKRIWQLHNTKKLDAIREEIDKIAKDEIEKSVLLTSLIIAMDKVDSSVGHQVSYLKKWAPRAYKIMKMEVPRLIIDDRQHQVYQKDIFDLVNDVKVDLAYYDPPYGSSNELMPPSRVRYASYYHIWKTICLNDKPKLVGVANRREDVGDTISGSIFEEFRKNNEGQYIVIEAIEKLIKDTPAKYVVLSYNNNGRATFQAIKDILENLKKKISIFEMDYKKNVMATITRTTNEWINDTNGKNKEYLFLIHKNGKTEVMPEIKVEKIDIRNLIPAKQQRLVF